MVHRPRKTAGVPPDADPKVDGSGRKEETVNKPLKKRSTRSFIGNYNDVAHDDSKGRLQGKVIHVPFITLAKGRE